MYDQKMGRMLYIKKNNITRTIFFGLSISFFVSCTDNPKTPIEQTETKVKVKATNPVVYFEIPVVELDRAINFYKAVFQFDFSKSIIDNNEMALFPFVDHHSGISGALAKGDIYKPTRNGVVIYFNTENMDETLKLATINGGKILYPKTDNGIGLVAEFEDTEGNRIALYQKK